MKARIYEHFQGACAEAEKLVQIMVDMPAYAATELAYPSAVVYVNQALERYGEEPRERARVNARDMKRTVMVERIRPGA